MKPNEQKSKIEELKKTLYSRTSAPQDRATIQFHQTNQNDVPNDWQRPEEGTDTTLSGTPESGSTFFHKILVGSLIFFLVALGVGAFILWRGSNIVSADNVDIAVTGPVSIAGGDTLSMDVKVTNKNKVKLTLVDLSVDFPAGTVDPNDNTKELTHFRQNLNDIESGASDNTSVKAVLYGEENTKKEIAIKVEYRVPGSNAVFYKEKTYDIFINSSPVTLAVSSFSEVNSGQQFDMTALVTSNSKTTLKNLLVRVDYPFGFTFITSNPKALSDNKTWNIGDLKPGEKRTIKITGKIDGQDNEERVFKFAIGTASSKIPNSIGTQFVTTANAISLKKPFLSTGISLNGGVGDMVGHPDEPVNADISWTNNLPTNITDAEIKVTLSGSALDKTSVSADRGFYRSSDSSIVWDQTTARELASLSAGQSGDFNFKFTPRVAPGQINPIITIDVSVKATRISEKNVPEQILSTIHRSVRVAPNLDLAGQVLRTIGPFANTGQIPPKVDSSTTYTLVWTVSNTSSNISNAEVVATLPTYVKWLSMVSPAQENISYDAPSGRLVWRVGNLPAYTGINTPRREVSFKVEFDPSVSQVGQSPVLINEATLTGQDQFSGANISVTKQALTTRFSTDPGYHAGDETVRN